LGVYGFPVGVPRTGHELVTCHYPLRVDTYLGCFHICEYCYARASLTSRNLWRPDNVRVADIRRIRRIFESYLDGVGGGVVGRAIRRRVPARLGAWTDCFQPVERGRRATLELIRFLNSIDYPYLIVTKSGLVCESPYLDEIRGDLAYVQVTVTTLDEELAGRLEPRAPPPEERLRALETLNDCGIYAAGRVSPIIPNITDQNCFHIVERLVEIGVPHIVFEFFRGDEQIIRRVERATGKSIPGLYRRGYHYRVRWELKGSFYERVAERLRGERTLFTFCSDGDHSTLDCCGADGNKRIVPNTRFNLGNERVASAVYRELVKRGTVGVEDLEPYFSLSEKVFLRFWRRGLFEYFVPNCRYDKETNIYTAERELSENRGNAGLSVEKFVSPYLVAE